MAVGRKYTVVEADFYDEQEGLTVGAVVEAVPAENARQLLVTQIVGVDFPLEEPTLNHPGLMTLFDAGAETRTLGESQPILTMELADGKDLKDRLQHGPVTGNDLAVCTYGHGRHLDRPSRHPPGCEGRRMARKNVVTTWLVPVWVPIFSDSAGFGRERHREAPHT
ncbi:hypothetical protein [Arthrobacter sp. PsM3]|uniref:hypothetical protein n=1 Tax=Arthrobacter sp. PsM3 TaxID=3030531 RepID=UPI00263A644B|nr:hypothetical protein [Arthrobacter sp. PsM3]MDN4642645.1 hypothetical protein [Arthrobacter sp. PsM3]